MDDDNCPLPYVDFNKFCEYQTDLLLKETDSFFKSHNLRLRKYVLPVKLPEWAKTFSEVLDRGQEYEPLTTIYRHKHFLKCRILHNYSYIETKWNRSTDVRNKNIPFDLRPLTSEILNQLDIINEDMLDPEFSGLLVTLNTNTFGELNQDHQSNNDNDDNLSNLVNGVKSNELNGTYELNGNPFQVKHEELHGLLNGLDHHDDNFGDDRRFTFNEKERNGHEHWSGLEHEEDSKEKETEDQDKDKNELKNGKEKTNHKDSKDQEKNKNKNRKDNKDKEKETNGVKEHEENKEEVKNGKVSKIIAGALVECLVTNERCIKSIWLHPDLSKHSSRIVLQSFLPRLMYEIFLLPSVVTDKGVSTYNKFTYIMHNDLDLFPRQCWLLLASNKKMSLPRHYEPSTFEEHPVQLEYGDCHTDEVGYLFSKHRHRNMPVKLSSFNRLANYKYNDYVMEDLAYRETRRNNSLRDELKNGIENKKEKDEKERENTKDSKTKEEKEKDNKENKEKTNHKDSKDQEKNKNKNRKDLKENKDAKDSKNNHKDKDSKNEEKEKDDDKMDVDLNNLNDRNEGSDDGDGKRPRRPKRNCVGNYRSSPKFNYSMTNGNLKNSKKDNKNGENKDSSKDNTTDSNTNNTTSSKGDKNNKNEKQKEVKSRETNYSKDTNTSGSKDKKDGDEEKNKENVEKENKNEDDMGKDTKSERTLKDLDKEQANLKDKEDKSKNELKNGKENKKEKDEKERLTKLIGSNTGLKQLKELFLQVGSVTSTRDVCCTCRKEKLTKSVDDQAWLDRLVGCTENYMYLMLPKRCERSRLGLLVRDGWRDLLTPHLDPVLMNDINNLLPEYARNDGYVFKNNTVNYNADVEEWCRLRREDLIDVTSDTEVYMRLPDNCN